MKKIINGIKHHLDDYECMWNGIEDLYMTLTKSKVPKQFFFAMSGFCSFVYLRTNKSEIKRLVWFNDGRTKQMYKFLAPIVNFDYKFITYKTPESALKKLKKEIDNNYPVIIGALDMYYLEYYPKYYHKQHIPIHYVMVIGYDDNNGLIYLYDGGIEHRVALSYENLLLSWQAECPGISKANTLCTIRMDKPKTIIDISKEALRIKAEAYFHSKASFLGFNGIKRLAKEMVCWEKELGKEDTRKALLHMIKYLGSVPSIPNILLGSNEEDKVNFMCSRDKMSEVLIDLNDYFMDNKIINASILFNKSGQKFAILCKLLISYILGESNDLVDASKIISEIGDTEAKAYQFIYQAVNKF